MFSGGFSTKDFMRPRITPTRGALSIKRIVFMAAKVYASRSYASYFRRHTRGQYLVERPAIEQVAGGIIANEHSHGFGVFTADGVFVKSSRQFRKNNSQFVPHFNAENIPFVDRDVVFVGNVYPQFGHFLLEHMNRAWAFLNPRYKDMTAVLINNQDVNPVPGYMYELLEMLGVRRENILILDRTTRFRNVYVPAQGFNLPVWSCAEFGATYDRIGQNVGADADACDKIYVSRVRLARNATYGEEKVQKIFEKNGYRVIYPETLPLRRQIEIVRGCKSLAGAAGTALHLALFMKPGGTVIQIKRNRMHRCSASTQNLINDTKGLHGVFISGSVEKCKTDHGANSPQIIGVTKYMRRFFDENGFEYDTADVAADDAAMNAYTDALRAWRAQHGTVFINKVKRLIVKLSALVVPGRERRGRFRKWMKAKLKIA